MIRNIIFDFGGVILDLAPDRCKANFRALGFHEIDSLLTLTHQKGLLDEMERGVITAEYFCDAMREKIAASRSADPEFAQLPLPTDEQIHQAWCSMADGIPTYRLEAIDALKQEGYHVSALSNSNVLHWECCRPLFEGAGYPSSTLFEYTWLSYEMHLVKPDPQIFARLLEESGYIPEETLFIDDAPSNCRAAEAFGIRTFTPSIRTDWRAELRELLAQYNS